MASINKLLEPIADAVGASIKYDRISRTGSAKACKSLSLFGENEFKVCATMFEIVVDEDRGAAATLWWVSGMLGMLLASDERRGSLTVFLFDMDKCGYDVSPTKGGGLKFTDKVLGRRYSKRKYFKAIAPGVKAVYTQSSKYGVRWAKVKDGPQIIRSMVDTKGENILVRG